MTDFPMLGDNFTTVGPWRVLDGRGWQRWQRSAIAAEIAASQVHGDAVAAARLRRELRARKAEAAARSWPARPDGSSRDPG